MAILDEGGYARYDFSTATKLLAITGGIRNVSRGDLNVLHDCPEGPRNLEARLMGLGKGIGPVTANIFLREMRSVWLKADPAISPLDLPPSNRSGAWLCFSIRFEEKSNILLLCIAGSLRMRKDLCPYSR